MRYICTNDYQMQITLSLPDIYFLENSESEIQQRIKLYIALMMYQSGQASAGAACEIANIDRYTFLEACKHYQIPTIRYDEAEVEAELKQFQAS